MKTVYTLPKSRILLLHFVLTLTGLTGAFSASAQTAGDYQSVKTGNWTDRTTWARYDGTQWVTLTTNGTYGYPGELTTAGAVTILAGHNVTADFTATQTLQLPNDKNVLTATTVYTTPYPIGKLTINYGTNGTNGGKLTINKPVTYINTPEIEVKAAASPAISTTPTGTIVFSGNISLALPPSSIISVTLGTPGGLSGTTNANVNIYIGTLWYAIGTSEKTYYNFNNLMTAGGNINAVILSPSPQTICQGTSLSLQGYFTGLYTNTTSGGTTPGVTYKWYDNGTQITGTNATGTITSPNINSTAFSYNPSTPGNHYLRFEVTTYLGTTEYKDTASVKIVVNTPSTAPTSLAASNSTICSGNSVTLTANGGVLGTGAKYQWSTTSDFNTVLHESTSSIYTPSPTTTTTYWVRIVNPGPCNTTSTAASTTVTVNTRSTAPTSITGNLSVCSGTNTTLTAEGGTLETGGSYEWGTGSTVGINPISGETGNTYSTPALTATTTYWVRRKDPAPCSTVTNGVTATVTIKQNQWTGATSSTWSEINNWTCKVPGDNEDVIFSTTASKNLILDTDRTIGNLTNQSGYALVIPTGKTLTINGTADVNSADRILIQSAANAANGSLIFTNPNLNGNVPATVEMYSKAYKGAPQTFTDENTGGTYTVSYRWQYFGIPVQTAVYNTVFEATSPVSYVRRSDETLNSDAIYYNEWVQLSDTDPLTPFTGYEITQLNPKKITFKGALVTTANQTLTLTKTTSGTTYDTGSGYNIFGNSFTAAIAIPQITFGSGVEQTVYLYNTGSLFDWYEATANTSSPGSYLAIPKSVSGEIQKEIPSMQGFMLIANSGYSGNDYKVTIPYNSTLILKNTFAQRSPSAGNSGLSYLTADVVGKSGGDRVWLFSQPETSRKYDNGWDGRKIILNPGFSLYVDEGKDQLQVSTSDNLDKTYLAFRAGNDTEYTLKINKTNLTDYQTLYLTDLATKTVVDLSALNEYSYAFTASNTAKAERRFLITTKDKKVSTKTVKVKIYSADKTLFVDNPSDESGEVLIYDMYGQLRQNGVLLPATSTEISTTLPPSVYLVRVKSAGIDQSDKIFIRK